jgi:hypothetical protein
MEEDSTNIVEEATLEMDEMLAGVMPSTWMGHARLVVAGRDLSEKQKAKVLEVTEKLVEEKGSPADKLAEVCVEKVQD